MAYRDQCTDTGRIGDGSQVNGKGAYGTNTVDFKALTIDEERDAGGFTKTSMPVGGTPPMKGWTPGNRHDDDPGGQEMQAAAARARVFNSNY